MRERPILSSPEEVRAILDGRKFQTRRIVKLQPGAHVERMRPHFDDPQRWIDFDGSNDEARCPYGVPGDRLWVRETCALVKLPGMGDWRWPEDDEDADAVWYRATDSLHLSHGGDGMGRALDTYALVRPDRWRPSIYMPRWASRITLELTDVRVQRLQDISGEDARAEGFGAAFGPGMRFRAFDSLWEHINGAGSWTANPWVWALTHERIDEVHHA